MKKRKNIVALLFAIVLVSITSRVYAEGTTISLQDIANKFNENVVELFTEDEDIEYDPDVLNMAASICTSEQASSNICTEGNLIITTTNDGTSSILEYEVDGNILSTTFDFTSTDFAQTYFDFINYEILVKSIGDVNGFNYNFQDLAGTLNSEDIFEYTLEEEGLSFTAIDEDEEIFEVKIDITKKIPVYEYIIVDLDADSGGEISVKFEGDEEDLWSEVSFGKLLLKKGESYTFEATPDEDSDEDYIFVSWTLNDEEEYSTNPVITLTITDDISLKANFEMVPKEITGAEINLVAPKVGDSITKIIHQDEDGEWEEQSDTPTVSTATEGLFVSAYWIKGLEDDDDFYGTFEKDNYYYAYIDIDTKYGYELSENFLDNLKINGVAPDQTEVIFDSWVRCVVKIKAEVVYTILEGDNQTYQNGKDLTIKADGDLADLVMLKVDGVELDSSNYTLESGSTIATLSSSYLSTLSGGSHTLTFIYNDGTVDATFNIPTANPKTADNIIVCLVALVLSFSFLVGTTIYLKNKKIVKVN